MTTSEWTMTTMTTYEADSRRTRSRGILRAGVRLAGGMVLACALALPGAAAAQTWEEMSASRRATGDEVTRVDLHYGAGRLQIRAGEENLLYRMFLRYDSERFEPVADYARGRLELGTRTRGRNINIDTDDESGELRLELSPRVPMELDLEFGAVRAELDLGGLHLEDLDISTGASRSDVHISRPTRGRIRTADFEVGAADFRARDLGNLRADRIAVEAGVGEVTLEFGGEWQEDMALEVEMGLGSLTINIPEDIGVRLDKDSFLMSLDADWLEKDGDRYFSGNWARAEHHLTIDVEAAFGSIELNRIR